jgi:hypothetical protein
MARADLLADGVDIRSIQLRQAGLILPRYQHWPGRRVQPELLRPAFVVVQDHLRFEAPAITRMSPPPVRCGPVVRVDAEL